MNKIVNQLNNGTNDIYIKFSYIQAISLLEEAARRHIVHKSLLTIGAY
jgi:hypothetical protein